MPSDLDFILSETKGLWDDLRNKNIFLTGGTGFFGTWLLETFAYADDQLDLGLHILVLSRHPEAFKKKNPKLANHRTIQFLQGDITDFSFPPGKFSHVIHAATEASVELNKNNPLRMLDTIVLGTRRALEFARAAGAHKFLLTSSGAVYGKQPTDLSHIPESYAGAPDPLDPLSAYGEGKRMAEHLGVLYHRDYGIETKIARCFAFVGPYLPLGGSFAVGNFIRDGLEGKTIQVNGDGTPYRSYLYAAELAIWLLTILVNGKAGRAYNVGSSSEITIHQLANTMAKLFKVKVVVAKSPIAGKPLERYVPDVTRAGQELGLIQKITLSECLDRTVHWHRENRTELRSNLR